MWVQCAPLMEHIEGLSPMSLMVGHRCIKLGHNGGGLTQCTLLKEIRLKSYKSIGWLNEQRAKYLNLGLCKDDCIAFALKEVGNVFGWAWNGNGPTPLAPKAFQQFA